MIVYQVMTRLFGNGKFSAFNKKAFDYLHTLGVSHIWYTGVIRHATGEDFVKGNPGSPYAISDYYDVNPYLATKSEDRMKEFENLVKRTHKAGFKVIIDFVPNHVAKNYGDGIPTFNHCDYDWTDTRKINYSHSDTWNAMLQIVRFWASKGVDGMRCDMVDLVPSDFFGWLTRSIKAEFPDFIFIAETYETGSYRPLIKDAGFDYLYDKSGLYDILRGILTNGWSSRQITGNWQRLSDLQPDMLNFLENHDEQRLASSCFAGSPERGYAALAVAALFNKASFMLYFGQERGERAPEASDGRTSIFNWTTVNSLKTPDGKVLERYREILSLAASISDWENYDLCYCSEGAEGFDPDRHFAFLRYKKGVGTLLFCCNFSVTDAEYTVVIPESLGLAKKEARIIVPASDFTVISLDSI